MRARAVLLVALLLWAAGCDAGVERIDPIPDAVPETIRYVALGDSLATGAGADTSYVAEYAAWLSAETGARVSVDNFAVNGATSRDLLDAVTGDEQLRTAVAGAHVITWDIGGNDLLLALASFLDGGCGGSDGQDCVREAVETVTRNSETMLDELLGLRADGEDGRAAFRTINLYLPFVGNPLVATFLDELRPYLERVNEELTRLSEARGIPVADVHEAFHGRDGAGDPAAAGLISDDGVHPSDRGHEVIAAELAALGLELGRPARGVR